MNQQRRPDGPDLSVLIATRNRASLLESTLRHLAAQDTTGFTWDLFVIDNGSTDDTPGVLARATSSLPLTALREPEAGKNRALNRALPLARGVLLVFTDDDVEPEPTWLRELLSAAGRWPDASIFGGVIVPVLPPATPAWLVEHKFATHAFARFQFPQAEGPLPPDEIPFGPNFAVRAAAMAGVTFSEQIGPRGKHYASGSESELLLRLMVRGATAVYVPAAVVRHLIEPSHIGMRWLLGRAFRLGRGQARLFPTRSSARLFGVARYLWRELAEASARCLTSLVRGRRARFDAGVDFFRVSGSIFESVRMTREAGRGPTT